MRYARGFTLVELVVVVVAIGILIGVALDQVLPLIGRAQRAMFLQVQSELQSALLLEAAERITRGESQTLAALAGTNPMQLLLRPPPNYLGAGPSSAAAAAPRDSWFFDEDRRELVYRAGRHTRFEAPEGSQDRAALKVAFVYADRDGNGAYDAAADRFEGLRLEPQHPFSWPD